MRVSTTHLIAMIGVAVLILTLVSPNVQGALMATAAVVVMLIEARRDGEP